MAPSMPARREATIGLRADPQIMRAVRWQTLQMQRPNWPGNATGIGAAALPLLAGVYLVVVAAVVLRPGPGASSYPDLSPALLLADVAAGIMLLAAGSLAWVLRRRRLGLLAILAGACWFGADWAGATTLAPGARYLGAIASMLTLPLLVHLVVHAHGADTAGRPRRVIAVLYGASGLLGVAWLAAYVPWYDPRCVALCDAQPGPLADYRIARVLAMAGQLVTAAAGIGLTGWAVTVYARSTAVARRRARRTLMPAALVGLAWTASAAALMLPSSLVPPLSTTMIGLYVARAATAALLGIGLAWSLIDERRTLLAVRRIANDLSPLPGGGSLRVALATAMGDPGLELVFPMPDGTGFVDGSGGAVADPSARPDLHRTPIDDGGRTVAIAVGDGAGPTVPIRDDIGDAVRLAAANERLLAAVRHEVRELQASRARIVETGDAARHALERDLHDGAQHRMLGVLHELSLAQTRAVEARDTRAAERLTAAIDEADAAIESLRRLARGIHPATLTEAGLLPSLEALADEARIPAEIDAPADARFPPEVEATAWRVVAQALAAADRLGAQGVAARVRLVDRHLELDIEIDGASSVPDTTALEDRVGAVGGFVTVQRPAADVIRLHVELPCA
jgi:signal transduction histidine kinase